MSGSHCPRLSQAKDLLPIIRAHLIGAAAHHSLPAGLSLRLLPIVEDGLVGYEFLPNWATYTYLTIGCDDRGRPVLRETAYRAEAPSVLRVAAVNGRALSQSELDASHRPRQRDSVVADWSAAAEAAWTGLAALFPEEPRQRIEVHDSPHECLDEALAVAHARLAGCDPCIDFCGIPDEAVYGFALTHAGGGRGQLVSRKPGTWALRWQSPASALHEEWAMAPPGIDAADAWVCASTTQGYSAVPASSVVRAFPAALARRPRRPRAGERRHGDRRSADRPEPDGHPDERRQGDRRQQDRRQTPLAGNPG
jgi:hypothetical protein